MNDGFEVALQDFYDRDLTFTVRLGDDLIAPYYLTVEADPGAPGQSIQVSRRSIQTLRLVLEKHLDAVEETP